MIEKTEAMKLLEQWRDHYYANTELIESLDPIFGGRPECKFFNTVWKGFDQHTVALAAALGDTGFLWLSWYAHDCEMGQNPHDGSPPGGKKRKIRTLAQLLKIIEESRDV